MDRILWAELYQTLERLEGDARRLRQYVDPDGQEPLQHLQDEIRHCGNLVRGRLNGTPASAAYLRLVGLSGE